MPKKVKFKLYALDAVCLLEMGIAMYVPKPSGIMVVNAAIKTLSTNSTCFIVYNTLACRKKSVKEFHLKLKS